MHSLAHLRRPRAPLLEKTWFLERAFDDGLGVYVQPVLQYGGVQTAEVQGGSEVTLSQVFHLPGRILAILTTLHRVTDHKGHTTRAVVCARAVIAHTPTELGEQEHDHMIGSTREAKQIPNRSAVLVINESK